MSPDKRRVAAIFSAVREESVMRRIEEVMSTGVTVVSPEQPLQEAARLMADLDVGSLPVCDGRRLLGIVTDRDITVRAIAAGRGVDTPVREIMSGEVIYATSDQPVEDVMREMAEAQVRRIPVVDADRKLVGIVSLGDLALEEEQDVDKTLREVSKPG
jgi:CBS domain-containing protein